MQKYITYLFIGLVVTFSGINTQAGQSARDGFGQSYYTQTDERGPYAGVDYSYLQINYESINGFNFDELFPDEFHGFGPYVGVGIDKHFDLEVGYTYYLEEEKTTPFFGPINLNTEMALHNISADLNGRYEVAPGLNLLGNVGYDIYIADLSFSLSCTGCGDASGVEDVHAVAAGAGLQYEVMDDISVRAMAKYNRFLSETDIFKDAYQFNGGLNVRF